MQRLFAAGVLVFGLAWLVAGGSARPRPAPPATSRTLAHTPWPKAFATNRNESRSEFPGAQQGRIRWAYPTSFLLAWVGSPVTIGLDGEIYYPSRTGPKEQEGLTALSATGKLLWRLDCKPGSPPTVSSDGRLFFGEIGYEPNTRFFCLDRNGRRLWTVRHGAENFIATPTLSPDGTLFAPGRYGGLLIFATQSAQHLYLDQRRFDRGGHNWSPAVLEKGGTILFNTINDLFRVNREGRVQAVRKQRNPLVSCTEVKDPRDLDPYYQVPQVLTESGILLYSANCNGRCYLVAWRETDGQLWSYQVRLGVPPAVGADGSLYTTALDGRLVQLRPTDGTVLRFGPPGGQHPLVSPAIDSRGNVYAVEEEGNTVVCLTADLQPRWRLTLPEQVRRHPVIGPNSSLIVPGVKHLYCIE